jgi:hypothetical protein
LQYVHVPAKKITRPIKNLLKTIPHIVGVHQNAWPVILVEAKYAHKKPKPIASVKLTSFLFTAGIENSFMIFFVKNNERIPN